MIVGTFEVGQIIEKINFGPVKLIKRKCFQLKTKSKKYV